MPAAASPATGRTPIRGTQSFVYTLSTCWRRPSLTALEVLWRWTFGIPALALIYFEATRILNQTPIDTAALTRISLFDPLAAAATLSAAAASLLPPALRVAAWDVRKYYPVAVVTSNTKIFSQFGTPSLPGFPWILSTWVTGPGGKPASPSVANQILNGPGPSTGGSVPPGYTEWNRWIPLSHYWPMQFIEAGWLLVLAVALFAATVALVRRRAA